MHTSETRTRWIAGIVCTVALVVQNIVTPGQLWAQAVDQVLPAASRTDSFDTKMELLQSAWKSGDFDLARSLTHSLRDSVIQVQHEQQLAGPTVLDSPQMETDVSLPEEWKRWAQGWKYFKTLSLQETAGESRTSEPVEATLSFPDAAVLDLPREIRLARVDGERLVEVPCQVFRELRRSGERICTVLWMTDSGPRQEQTFLVFYGNPDSELPAYPSDLLTEGEGFGLDISNSIFNVSLSRQTGQIERLTLRREHGLELFSGGQGHGEPPGIDWAHDYVDADHFQKFRISLWDRCPDYEVIRGPLCTIVRRWGFPYSPVHPVYSPSRLHVEVEYRFYSGLPWFHKTGAMKAIQSFEAAALRDDEWVFSGHSFTDKMWMGRDGKLRMGDVASGSEEDLWGVGFFHRVNRDSFMALFLEHSAEGLPEPRHSGSPTLFYRWHGSLWSRYPLPVKSVPAGAVLRQKNAYVSIPFTEKEGKATIEKMRRCMMQPLTVSANTALDVSDRLSSQESESESGVVDRLARPGEAGDQSSIKQLVWQALRDCKDAQLYKADINVVDLGLVYDVRIRGDVVTVVMAMPHRGRPLLGYFVDGSISVHPTKSVPVRERLMQIPGVRQVVVKQIWEPAWSSNRLTDAGRLKLGLK